MSRKCQEAVLALLTEKTVQAAAKKVGVSAKTLLLWQKIPEFQKLLREARERSFDHALSRLQSVMLKAVAGLELVLGRKRGDDLRVKAADLILSHALKAAEVADIRERLEAVEETLASANGKPR